MNFDSSFDPMCNSARTAAEARRQEQEIQNAASAHRKKLEAGAEAAMEQKALLEQQNHLLKIQNGQLTDNYNKLKELYDSQVASGEEAQKELKKSKRFNAWMMVIAIISMLAALAGPIIPVLI